MRKDIEIEAKFRVEDDQTFPRLLGMTQVDGFALVPAPEVEYQRNIYFDTLDWRLRTGHYGLRIREVGRRRIATLKGESRINAGIHERSEWEGEIGADDRPAAWPPGELRDRVLGLLEHAPLHQILTISTHRQHIYASRGLDPLIEVSLDEGTIHAGGRTEYFRELELELLPGGARADLDTLVAHLCAALPLIPENRSKLARGLALLEAAAGE